MRHELFAADELEPGQMREVKVGSLSVVVVRLLDGRFTALKNRCSHLGAPLSSGRVEAMVSGERVGERALSERLVIRCPWHGFEFDAETGLCPADPERTRVRAYPVTVEGGNLVLER